MTTFTSTILITGGTNGLGYEAALNLAQRFPQSKVLICSRSNNTNAVETLTKSVLKSHPSHPRNQIEWLALDLNSLTNVRTFVKNLTSQSLPPITHLLLNAGIQFHTPGLKHSPDGIESTFAINHVGHALLFFLLKPHLAPTCRIILVASGTHDPAQGTGVPDAVYDTAELLAHPPSSTDYSKKNAGGQIYASTKLANVLFTYAIERRLSEARARASSKADCQWTVAAFDPGLMPGTSLVRDHPIGNWIFVHLGFWLTPLFMLLLRSTNVHRPSTSGRNLADLASLTGEKAVRESGKYYEGKRAIESSVVSYNAEKQEDLWKWTVENVSLSEEEKAAFEKF